MNKTILAVFILALCIGTVSVAGAAATMADLENALMCICDDKCGKVIINCTCATSDKTRAEFRKQMESGLTVEQIIQKQVEKHGEAVLSAPSKNGFNLTAWITPFAAIVVGGLGIRKLIQAWVGKNRCVSPSEENNPDAPVDNKYAKQLQSELERLEN